MILSLSSSLFHKSSVFDNIYNWGVGWRRGISPPRSHGSVRDSLPSYGSYHPTARHILSVLPYHPAPPISGWPNNKTRWFNPFAPSPLQELQHYYELIRPCAPHRYSHSCGFLHLNFSLSIGTTGSHVPHKSLNQVRATFMPDVAQTVNRFPLSLSWRMVRPPVLTSSNSFRHLISSSLALASLNLTWHGHAMPFALTLTTMALNQCSSRWFEACSCKPTSRDLPSSLVQHRGALTTWNHVFSTGVVSPSHVSW